MAAAMVVAAVAPTFVLFRTSQARVQQQVGGRLGGWLEVAAGTIAWAVSLPS
jgi:hypothetical protein